jgi:hypothetical protein
MLPFPVNLIMLPSDILLSLLLPEDKSQPSQSGAEEERADRPYHGYHTHTEYNSTYSKKDTSPFGKKAGARFLIPSYQAIP